MKYTTKQLFEMNEEDLNKICNYCNGKCPFKESLRKYREDGFCVKSSYAYLDDWIEEDEAKLKSYERGIKYLKERIKRYKKFKNLVDKELEEVQNEKEN